MDRRAERESPFAIGRGSQRGAGRENVDAGERFAGGGVDDGAGEFKLRAGRRGAGDHEEAGQK
jgi:hypothetical protein